MAEGKVLIGRKAICAYLGVGKNLFYPLVEEGMPVKKGIGGWRSHSMLLDEYFMGLIRDSAGPPGKEKPVKP